MPYQWDIAVGDHLSREDRQARFGGSIQGGIQPSSRTPNVFLYSDPTRGDRHGYVYDGWGPGKDIFFYTGEGTVGPQQMTKGNKAILRHQADGRNLRLFVANGTIPGRAAKNQLYLGEFAVDEPAWTDAPAPDQHEAMRSVFIFRLRPVGDAIVRDADLSRVIGATPTTKAARPDAPTADDTTALVGLEAGTTPSFAVPSRPGATAVRREYELVERFRASLGARGRDLQRWRIRLPDFGGVLFTDLYDVADHELFEVKATNSREAVRVALGQLLDYRQWLTDPAPRRNTVVIAGYPPAGMIQVLNAVGVGLIYEDPETGEFVRHDP